MNRRAFMAALAGAAVAPKAAPVTRLASYRFTYMAYVAPGPPPGWYGKAIVPELLKLLPASAHTPDNLPASTPQNS